MCSLRPIDGLSSDTSEPGRTISSRCGLAMQSSPARLQWLAPAVEPGGARRVSLLLLNVACLRGEVLHFFSGKHARGFGQATDGLVWAGNGPKHDVSDQYK